MLSNLKSEKEHQGQNQNQSNYFLLYTVDPQFKKEFVI